jgi:hypothetical protein
MFHLSKDFTVSFVSTRCSYLNFFPPIDVLWSLCEFEQHQPVNYGYHLRCAQSSAVAAFGIERHDKGKSNETEDIASCGCVLVSAIYRRMHREPNARTTWTAGAARRDGPDRRFEP